jgi:hypothetical protein
MMKIHARIVIIDDEGVEKDWDINGEMEDGRWHAEFDYHENWCVGGVDWAFLRDNAELAQYINYFVNDALELEVKRPDHLSYRKLDKCHHCESELTDSFVVIKCNPYCNESCFTDKEEADRKYAEEVNAKWIKDDQNIPF